MKIRIAAYMIVFLGLMQSFIFTDPLAAQNDNVIDEVVWVVGGEPILKSEVESRLKDFLSDEVKIDGDPYCFIPEQLAIEKLYLDQAKLDSIEVTDQEVIERVENKINDDVRRIGSVERLEQYFGMTLEQIKEKWRPLARTMLIVGKVQENLVKNVNATPAEVRRYFNKLPADSIPFIPTQVEAQILIVEPKVSEAEIENVKSKLREFADRVNNGETAFSTLATLYSEDGSSRRGGELGFKGKGEFVPEFAEVAFNLTDPKRVSKIVKTEFGYHIIQLIEKRGDRINCRHILINPVPTNAEIGAALTRLDSISTAIKKNEISFEQAVMYFSTDKATRNNSGNMANSMEGAYSTSRFKLDELPPEVGKTVESLKVGELSKPFLMIDRASNKKVCAVVKLKNRIEGHVANTGEDFQELKSIVEMSKKDLILRKWISEKQKSTYVRINEKWRKCDFQYKGWVKE
ncbi:MAG: peptidylprolyl isomerase [Bacteroidales bacterium]|nr:peptidylprolyl isomerase [Bacteroidales bacterium]MDD4821124.1 peptidylprolyl isomerase [Bacteroidales bacterium]